MGSKEKGPRALPVLALGAGLGGLVNLVLGLLLFRAAGPVLVFTLLGGLLGLALAGFELRLRTARPSRGRDGTGL